MADSSPTLDMTTEEMVAALDRYEAWNAERGLSRCPWCGDDINPGEKVVRIDGREGHDILLSQINPYTRTYHPPCRRKRTLVRRAIENEHFDAFAPEEPDAAEA